MAVLVGKDSLVEYMFELMGMVKRLEDAEARTNKGPADHSEREDVRSKTLSYQSVESEILES